MKKRKNKNTDKYIFIGLDTETNGLSSGFGNKQNETFIAFKYPILLKTNAVFCNGRKKKRKK